MSVPRESEQYAMCQKVFFIRFYLLLFDYIKTKCNQAENNIKQAMSMFSLGQEWKIDARQQCVLVFSLSLSSAHFEEAVPVKREFNAFSCHERISSRKNDRTQHDVQSSNLCMSTRGEILLRRAELIELVNHRWMWKQALSFATSSRKMRTSPRKKYQHVSQLFSWRT